MSLISIEILPGDIFGFLALAFIGITSIFMLLRKRLLRYTKNLELLRKIHIYVAALGGLFLILHAAYFDTWPLTTAIDFGYVSAAVAGVVWLTGTAFLERFRDSLFYHGSLSLATISLMVIHAAGAGLNFPEIVAYAVIVAATLVTLYKASRHASKTLKAAGLVERKA